MTTYSIQVRLDGQSEEIVRLAAAEMQVQVNRVKQRDDSWQLYGSRIITLHGSNYANDAAAQVRR